MHVAGLLYLALRTTPNEVGGSGAHSVRQHAPTSTALKTLPETSMKNLTTAVRNFIREDEGAALVEYAILVALIAVIAIIFVTSLGKKVSNKFSEIDSKL